MITEKEYAMRKTKQIFFSLLVMSILGGVIVLAITVISPAVSLPVDAPMWMIGNIANPSQQACNTKLTGEGGCGGELPSGCIVFTVSKGEQVFFG
jgi:hypothetical protein